MKPKFYCSDHSWKPPNQPDYNIFAALVETIHKKDRGRLQFAKCQECERLTPFRLISVASLTVKCKKCGNIISVRTEQRFRKGRTA